MKEKFKTFETVQEFIDYTLNEPTDSTWNGKERASREGSNSFTGTYTFSEACKLATDGWPDGLKKVTEKLGLSLSHGRSKIRIHDVAGDLPDIGRFLASQPDCMSRRVVQQGMKKPIIDIVLNGSYSAYINTDKIINYGAAIASVIDELENAGFSVGLQVCGVTSSGKGCGPIINIKKPGEPMEIDRMIFFTAHPSFFRRFCFSFFESTLDRPTLGHDYGIPQNLDKQHIPEGAIYFPCNKSGEGVDNQCGSIEGAREYVKSIVRKQRPDLFPDEAQAA